MVSGPVVVPGTYKVVLTYGGQKSEQSFTVTLDPRIHATQQDLEAQLALCQQVETDLNALDKDINDAIAARDKLNRAVADGSVAQAKAASALDALNNALDDAVQMNNFASEEDLMHEVKLNALLAFLGADVQWGYVRPTAAQVAVFHQLDAQSRTSEQKLESSTRSAAKIAP